MIASPFATLALGPTLDFAVIKRAYFAALTRHPPHADPEGFRRVREAYERLTDPADRLEALLSTPVDVARALADAEASVGQEIAAAASARAAEAAAAAARTNAAEALARLPLHQALTAFD